MYVCMCTQNTYTYRRSDRNGNLIRLGRSVKAEFFPHNVYVRLYI